MADDPITSFTGEYAFLSNFCVHPVEINGDTYPTNEHAFQALKTDDPAEREKVRLAKTPASAKSPGKHVALREGWDTLRFAVMERLVRLGLSNFGAAAGGCGVGASRVAFASNWVATWLVPLSHPTYGGEKEPPRSAVPVFAV